MSLSIHQAPKMPFGKHKNKPITEVPLGYLRWLKDNCNLYGWLKDAVDALIAGRPLPEADEAIAERITKPYTPAPGEPPPYYS